MCVIYFCSLGREIQQRWTNLRNCFLRELREQKKDAFIGPAASKRRKYLYYEQMLFLLPTLQDRETDYSALAAREVELKMEAAAKECENAELDIDVHAALSGDALVKIEQLSPEILAAAQIDPSSVITPNSQNRRQRSAESANGGINQHRTPSWTSPRRRRQIPRFYKPTVPVASRPRAKKRRTCYNVADVPTPAPSSSVVKEKREVLDDVPNDRHFLLRDKQDDVDEDKCFLLSLLPAFRRMNQEDKFEARIEIMRVMQRVSRPAVEDSSSASFQERHIIPNGHVLSGQEAATYFQLPPPDNYEVEESRSSSPGDVSHSESHRSEGDSVAATTTTNNGAEFSVDEGGEGSILTSP